MNESESWEALPSLQEEHAALALLRQRLPQEPARQTLLNYCRAVAEFNLHSNLVANAELAVLLKEHLLDSLELLPYLHSGKRRAERLIDIGSGAGFPGMVLAIAEPALHVTLVDSIGKKCRFLESAVANLGLQKRVKVICERAETLGHDGKLRERFDLSTARAVAALPVVAELCLPFLKKGGLLLAQRSKRQALLESAEADAYASRLGGTLKDTVYFEPDLLGRELALLVIEKQAHTPRIYPRSAAQLKRSK